MQPKAPTPSSPTERKQPHKHGGVLGSLVEAEKLMQIAFLIPSATVIGWLIGVGLDHALHQKWIYVAGLLFGAVAGFVQMFRVVLQNTRE